MIKMAGSDDSISSAASSGSDGEHSSPASITQPSSSSQSKRRRDGTSSLPSSTIRHRHRHKLSHRFEFVRTLGCGTYGKVKLAIQLNTGEEVAIKCVPKSKIDNAADLRRLRQEIEVMSSLHHPHIIEVTEVFESRDKIVMVMEHACGGELYDFINDGKMTASQAKELFRQIVTAVQYLHQNGIVHRDLKLENVLLDQDYKVKIADFGLSSTFDQSSLLDTFCGSPLYASPEIINGTPYSGPEVDCWSLGVILYAMVYKTMPFHGADFTQLKAQITKGLFTEPSTVSDASDLIHCMLTLDPCERIKIDDILNHPWVSGGGVPPTVSRKEEAPCRKHSSECVFSNYVVEPSSQEAINSLETVNSKKPLTSILKKSSQRRYSEELSEECLFPIDNKIRPEMRTATTTVHVDDQSKEVEPAKKGILKRRAKDSSGDSGLEINESGQNKSGASLESGDSLLGVAVTLPEKGANKRDSGIDQDLMSCCLLQECGRYETCQLRPPPARRLNLGDISKRHSRGKYSRVTQMWESIYSTCKITNDNNNVPLITVEDDSSAAMMPLPHDVSSSSNEDILEILDSPGLRTVTGKQHFQYRVGETDPSETVLEGVKVSPPTVDDQEERYTTDELMSAMDEELLEVYQKALKISQAVV